MNILKEAFTQVDKYSQDIVPREKLLYELKHNPKVLKLLNKLAGKRNNKPVKLSTILSEIDQDDINEQNQIATGSAIPGVTFQNRLMEYITWNQFLDYFEKDNEKVIITENKQIKLKPKKIKPQISQQELKILNQIFNSLIQTNSAVNLLNFTNACLKDPLFNSISDVIAR